MMVQFEDLIFVLMTGYFGYSAWRQMNANSHFYDAMNCDPNTWRWWNRLLIRFHNRPFSVQVLKAFSWIVVLNVLYFVLMPVGIMRMVFLLMVLAMSTAGYVSHSPMYPLLLLVGLVHPIFLIPLTLVKEVGGWIGVGLLLYQGRFVEAIVYGGISALIYGLVRIRSGKEWTRIEGVVPFFTPSYIWSAIKSRPQVVVRDLVAIIPLFVLCFWEMPLLFIWVAIPIVLFALLWEPHLWFPLLIIAMGVL